MGPKTSSQCVATRYRLHACEVLANARTAGLLIDKSRPTTVKTRLIARSQQMLRVDEESAVEIDPTLLELGVHAAALLLVVAAIVEEQSGDT